jgi:hypothetical protein
MGIVSVKKIHRRVSSVVKALHVRWLFVEVGSPVCLHRGLVVDPDRLVGVDRHHHCPYVGLEVCVGKRLKRGYEIIVG